MTAEDALVFVKILLKQNITDLQELVFRRTWEGKTYRAIAHESGYDSDYIKYVGFQLWQLLSQNLGRKVTKSNLKSVLRRVSQEYQPSPDQAPHFSSLPVKRSCQDWAEAMDTAIFYGRVTELSTLEEWILQDRCRLVTLFGMAGVGKTALAIKLATQLQDKFQYVIWRSLRNAPPIEDLLTDLIQFLSSQEEPELPKKVDQKILQLLDYLRTSRCLLILDNADSLLGNNGSRQQYKEGYERYGQLLRCIGEAPHQSCLILTSREKIHGVISQEGAGFPVQSLQLKGLGELEVTEILKASRLVGTATEYEQLVKFYGGNPLALKLVSAMIRDFFDGEISEFLSQQVAIFNGIRKLLDQQFYRLSDIEKQVMYWLAINQELVSFSGLSSDINPPISKQKLLDALQSLRGHSLIEKRSAGFTQPPVIREYLREKLAQQDQGIITNDAEGLMSQALPKSQETA